MTEGHLYERVCADGATVRIRRTSAAGSAPVIAVLERIPAANPLADAVGDSPPAGPLPLLEVMAETELDALLVLEPHARSEAAIERLVRARG